MVGVLIEVMVDLADLAVIFLGFGGGFGVEVVQMQEALQVEVLLLAEVGYGLSHLNL